MWHLKSVVNSSKEKLHEALVYCIKVKNNLIRNLYWICIMHSFTPILRIALLYGVILFRIFLTRWWNYRNGLYAFLMGGQIWSYHANLWKLWIVKSLKLIYIYCVQIFLYKHHQGIVHFFFKMSNAAHEYYTRQEKQFHVLLCKSVQKSKCLRCSGVNIYNYLIEHMN